MLAALLKNPKILSMFGKPPVFQQNRSPKEPILLKSLDAEIWSDDKHFKKQHLVGWKTTLEMYDYFRRDYTDR